MDSIIEKERRILAIIEEIRATLPRDAAIGWQRRALSTFLTKSEDWIQPDPERTYKQIKVRLWGKGLTLRARISGANIKALRQIRASAGQFLISRIDARHGAFGIVPKNLDGALVSNDFPCFEIDLSVVLPRYLEWYVRTNQFVDLCRQASEGSTNRVRLKGVRFMAMEIPVPSVDTQRRIVCMLDRVTVLVELHKNIVEELSDGLLPTMMHRAFRNPP